MNTQPATAKVEPRPLIRKLNLRDTAMDALGQLEEIESLAILIRSYVDGQQPILDSAVHLLGRAAHCCMKSLSAIVDAEDQKERQRHARSHKR
jgi:hypothetical protein